VLTTIITGPRTAATDPIPVTGQSRRLRHKLQQPVADRNLIVTGSTRWAA